MPTLEGKSIIVTGGASGIGRAAALIMARAGGRMTIADLNADGAEETVSLIREEGGEALAIRADVSDDGSVGAMVKAAVDAFGRLDGAFNNAGVPPDWVPFTDLKRSSWDRNILVNLTGVYLCMKYEILSMLSTGGGAIVNTSSVAGVFGQPLSAEYSASKHGVIGLTKALAIEYGKRNIRVNAILPGGTLTPMMAKTFQDAPSLEQERAAQTPMGRFASSEEVGATAAWLLSDEATYVSGAQLAVDGGMTSGLQ